MKSLHALLVFPGIVLCLPHSSPTLQQRDSSSTESSSTSTTLGAAQVSAIVAAVLNDTTPRIGANAGIPKLTADDLEFIYADVPKVEASDDATNFKRDYKERVNSPEKWQDLKMDEWLQLYVNQRTIIDTSTKLIDSQDFARDFWLSSGQETEFNCNEINSQACVTTLNLPSSLDDISKEDLARATFVRQSIARWANNMHQAHDLLSFAASDSQTSIAGIRKAFQMPDATPPGDVMDVILPALGAIAIVFPAAAPVVGAVGAVAAIAKLVSRDIAPLELFPDQAISPELEALISPEIDQEKDKRDALSEARVDISTLKEKVQDLIDAQSQTSLEKFGKQAGKVEKFADQAAKVVAGIKALNPGLPKASENSWDSFDYRVLQILKLYPTTIERAYLYTKKTYGPSYITTDKVAENAASTGLAAILKGGTMWKYSVTSDTVNGQKANIEAFFRKVILSLVLKQQSVYFTRQSFGSETDCKRAVNDNSDYMDFKNSVCTLSKTKQSGWELRTARRPLTNKEDGTNLGRIGSMLFTFADWIYRGTLPGNNKQDRWQAMGDFQDNSGTYANLIGSQLGNAGIQLTFNDIFDDAVECMASRNQDPFELDWPSSDQLYAAMTIDGTSITSDSKKTPLCTFGLPIWELKPSTATWCRKNVRTRLGMETVLKPSGKDCTSFEWQLAEADAKMCGNHGTTSTSRPGCEKHDKGIYFDYGYS